MNWEAKTGAGKIIGPMGIIGSFVYLATQAHQTKRTPIRCENWRSGESPRLNP